MTFNPSPGKLVKFVDEKGTVVKEMNLNRRQRRQLKVKSQKK